MTNLELAQILYQMADFLEMKEVSFKPRAYEKAARSIESLKKDLQKVYQEGGIETLKNISGIGQGIAEKIEEYINTGRIKEYEKLKKESPVDIEELSSVEGMGPRKIKILYRELGVKNIKDLEKAAQKGRIKDLEGFGPKSEANILQAIGFVRQNQGRFLLGVILPSARAIVQRLKGLPQVKKISLAGSLRRRKEAVGDVDILVACSSSQKVMEAFVAMPEVVKVWARGPTKSSVRLKAGYDCDLRVVKKESFGAALQYFTGSKDHNIATRRIAIERNLKLSEYGVFKDDKRVAGSDEEEVYQAIGLVYMPPEIRTNTGEIEAAFQEAQGNKALPRLIGYDDIKGETQCHTTWSDGAQTIEEMARAAKKMGHQYIVITDHAGFLRVAHGMDEKRLLKYMSAIDRADKKVSGIKILKGAEVDIKIDGSMAVKDEVLAKLDIVIGSIHSGMKMSQKDATKRVIRAISNPHVNIIGHPTGRVIQKREGYPLDLKKVFQAAKKNRTAIEINAHQDRLDLKDTDIRQAIEAGVKMTMGTDAHSVNHLWMMELGIGQARRGWAGKSSVLNTNKDYRFFVESFKSSF